MNGPKIVTKIPGPKSMGIWKKEEKYMTTGLAPCTLYTPIVFEKGEGSILWDVDGNSYIDFAAGVLTNSTGHCHPHLVKKLKEQVDKLWHIHDFPCPDRYKLCELLAEKTPGDIDTFEFYSGGTETVEAAMRAAISYTGKHEFISFYGAFHGKTLGTRQLAFKRGFGPVPNGIRTPFANCYRCPFKKEYPQCDTCCADFLEESIANNSTGEIAGIIFEPILGAGGVVVPPKEFLQKIVNICRKKKILIIADEILTGIGRTGNFFAVEHFDIEPDLICSGKGLGSGFPVMVLGGKREIMTAKPYGSPGGASTSFGGNPLAIASALATIETIDKEKILANVRKVGDFMGKRLAEMKEKHPLIGDVRGKGLLYAVELVKDQKTKEGASEEGKEIYLECIRNGLKTLTTGYLARFSPPLNISLDLTKKALDIYERALEKVEKNKR